MKLYIVSYGDGLQKGFGKYMLVTEYGEALYGHCCSSSAWASLDLINDRPDRVAYCQKRFGNYKVLYLGEDDMTMEKISERNKNYYSSLPEEENEIT